MSGPTCLVCGRLIPKRTSAVFFGAPAHSLTGFSINRPERPKTKAEAAAIVRTFSNKTIVSCSYTHPERDEPRRGVATVGLWDGESYEDPFFDTNRCALRFAGAAARAGYRVVRK